MSNPLALPPALHVLKKHSDWSLARLNQWSQMQRECHPLHAYRETFETGAESVEGPLEGVPISVQEGLDDAQHLGELSPSENFARLRALGAQINGYTASSVHGIADGNFSPLYPQPHNPWVSPQYSCFIGANAGAAASLYSGALLSVSADNGGALCASASAFGVVGFRPSHANQYDDPFHLGYMGHRVSDVAFLYCLEQWGDSGLHNYHTIKLSAEHYQPQLQLPSSSLGFGCSEAAHTPFTQALEQWMGCGVNLRNRTLPSAERFLKVLASGPDMARLRVAERLQDSQRLCDLPDTLASLKQSLDYSHAHRMLRMAELQVCSAEVGKALHCEDILLCPTLTDSPATDPETQALRHAMPSAMVRNTQFASATNCCALTLPGPLDPYGFPSGVLLLAPCGQEIHLLSVGLAIEQRWGIGASRLGAAPALLQG